MGKELDLLTNYPKIKGNLKDRVASKTKADRTIAIQFGTDTRITVFNGLRWYRQNSYNFQASFYE